MVDRIKQVMEYYEETPATFAEKLGVNRSNLTHLFSGRNQPSLEFAKKVLSAYPEVRTEWLIMGVGEMIKDPDQEVVPPKKTFIQKDLFEMDDDLEVEENEIADESESVQEGTPSLQNEIKPNVEDTQKQSTIVKQVEQAETKLEDENVKTAPTVSQTTIAAETQTKIVAEKMVEKTVQHVENKQNNSAITPAATSVESKNQNAPAPCKEINDSPTVVPNPIMEAAKATQIMGNETAPTNSEMAKQKKVEKIIFFYDDDTFKIFNA